ncbi:MAG: bifunctional riboflavin kinase/FAD synthetase [Candidatus Aminicenantaceae bacterium]
MNVLYGIEKANNIPEQTSLAIGNFDGIHIGHQKILKCLMDTSKRLNLSSLVLTFHPHTGYMLKKKSLKLLQTLDQRLKEISKYDISCVLIVPFTKKFSRISSHNFIKNIVLETLHAKAVIIGEDFHFGKNREGNVSKLMELSKKYDFRAYPVAQEIISGKTVSSSLIRSYLFEGKIEEANKMLGKYYEITGQVIKGSLKGRTLGFPTANIQTENDIIPSGVFLTYVEIEKSFYPSLTNIGSCPTLKSPGTYIESHILHFHSSLYEKLIKVQFIKKIRDEIKFKNSEALVTQLKKDLKTAMNYFKV